MVTLTQHEEQAALQQVQSWAPEGQAPFID